MILRLLFLFLYLYPHTGKKVFTQVYFFIFHILLKKDPERERQREREGIGMAGLQRSAVSFRRQGSSGLVWEDRFVSEREQAGQEVQHEELEIKPDIKDIKTSRTVGATNTIERSRSNGGARGYRTGKVSPAIEPPSPKVSACGFCSAFGKTGKKGRRTKPAVKHRSR
ncbi:hypothetical protein I3842_01G246400 [Carya illinoinensis]|uniref:MAPK kinase substrate protein At1g80180-like n=2 Tax=Carya illinoinensis TaxID=32201 RepID=A0A922G7S0_CARIL|nr:hypothetical protein I3842_01G246400 [Carya illinoinensis]